MSCCLSDDISGFLTSFRTNLIIWQGKNEAMMSEQDQSLYYVK